MEQFKAELQNMMDAYTREAQKLEARKQNAKQHYINDTLQAELEAVRAKRSALDQDTRQRIRAAAEAAKQRIMAARVNGKDINTADFMLLDPQRIRMKQAEFDELCERYIGNRTMGIALRSYARETGLKFEQDGTNLQLQCQQVDTLAKAASALNVYARGGVFSVERALNAGGGIII